MSENVEFIEKHTKIAKIQQEMYERRLESIKIHENLPENVEKIERKTVRRGDKRAEFTILTTKKLLEILVRPTDKIKYIRAQNTREMFKMDVEDWKLAKDIPWFEESPGVLTTSRGQTFEDYVGIVGARRHPFAPRDKRREHYHNC